MKPEIKAELLRELTLDVGTPVADLGIRYGRDPYHPLYRGRPVTSFASWDLLNLWAQRELRSGVAAAHAEFGSGVTCSRPMGGITAALDSTERRIARFFGAESGVLFNSRAQAVLTIVTALCSEGVVVITRPLSPLPLADACSLVGAELVECESVDNLRTLLAKNVLTRRVIIALESISALTGEAVDISPWLSTAASAGAWVIVDETTGLGLNGIRGAGSAEAVPTSPALLARIVGFQHAIGHEASCVVGPVELRDLLIKRSRYLRQEPSPPSVAARLLDTAVDSIELALGAREMLAARSALVHRALKAQGWRMPAAAPSPIASLWFDTFQKAQEVQDAMLQRGILVEALPARSIRRNGAVLRALISIAHSQEELGALMSGFAEIKMRLDALKS